MNFKIISKKEILNLMGTKTHFDQNGKILKI